MTRRRFVLDHDFPPLVVRVPIPEVELVALASVDARLVADVEDWAVIAALGQRNDVDGFVTIDRRMLRTPKVLSVLAQTRLSLVVCKDVGNDPIAATGLALLHLPSIAGRYEGQAQLWDLPRPAQRRPEDLDRAIVELARHAKVSREALLVREQLTPEELARPVMDWYPGIRPRT